MEDKKKGTNRNSSENDLDSLLEGGVTAKNSRETIHCLNIIGQIEGHYLLGELSLVMAVRGQRRRSTRAVYHTVVLEQLLGFLVRIAAV